MRQIKEPPRSNNRVHKHTRAQPPTLLFNTSILPPEQKRADRIQCQTPAEIQHIHRLPRPGLLPQPPNKPPYTSFNLLLSSSDVARTKHRHHSLTPRRPVSRISCTEDCGVPFEVEVRVAGCFREAASLGVDCVQSCAVGYYAFAGSDSHDGAVFGVQGGEEAGFVA